MFCLTAMYTHASNTTQGEHKSHSDKITPELVDSLLAHGHVLMNKDQTLHYALNDFQQAYKYASEIHYTHGVMMSCLRLGNYYLSISDNANATMYFYLYRKQAEADKDTASIIDAFARLGLVMYNMDKWSDACNYFNQATQMAGHKPQYEHSTDLVDYLYGVSLVRLKKFGKARVLLETTKRKAQAKGDSMRVIESRLYINQINASESPGPKVVAEYDRILSFMKRHNELIGHCLALVGKAEALYNMGELEAANTVALEALAESRRLGRLYPIMEVLGTLVDIEESRGRPESALKYLEEVLALKDSTNNLEVASQISMMGASYEFEKREAQLDAEIQAKNRQNTIFAILFIMSFVVAVIVIYVLRLVRLQRIKLNSLLHNILPDHTVRELQDTGHSIPKAHKDVTIVFADVKSFTQIASNLLPDTLVQMLDIYFVRFDAIISKYGLEKIKTIGDAYMFVSGLTQDEERTAQRSAMACLEMIDTINELREEMQEKYGQFFEFRFGMHTGNVVSGVVGDIKYAFDIWGDAVNIAARMEETSETGKINISQDTMNILKDEFICSYRGSFTIKNRGEIDMYYLEGQKDQVPEGP